ncbi:hemolysin family protein [Azohydromonas sp.]|mgnify:CR=1 FL=1|uniref:hemolysin family protein n=1 Tax=Azohydromonas sp. TaxID=1872666 RepID=UPI002C43358F|nr:hemolysin family protein [Azohydromonas sp.]HMM84203.1 hemolysin family protein [Azohydromonas sp.]
MDTALLVFLILLNGAFAMAEMGLTAARKARLQVMVETGDGGARAAMALHDDPTRWLSTVQVGITSIGLLNGIVGEAAFAQPLAAWLGTTYGWSEQVAQIVATAGVIVLITYCTIVFGELVPKRLGQMYPEAVARLVARPMLWLSTATKPFVHLLSTSTHGVLRLLGISGNAPGASVTEEEIAAQLEEGVGAGVIEAQEHRMVRNVFLLDERQIGSMMIPRAEIVWIDATADAEEVRRVLDEGAHSRYPVCRGGLDDVLGVVSSQRLLRQMVHGQPLSLADQLEPPVFVPETLSGMELLEHFKLSGAELVFVVDEYGAVQGVVTVRDLLEAITGEFTPAAGDEEEAWAVQRDDGSWLLDGLIPVPELKDRLQLRNLPDEERGRYNTLAGMIMLLLGRLPQVADQVEWQGWRFEIVDMDGKRVDKVMVSPLPPPPPGETT